MQAWNEGDLSDHVVLCAYAPLDVPVMYVNLGGKDNSQAPSGSTELGIPVWMKP